MVKGSYSSRVPNFSTEMNIPELKEIKLYRFVTRIYGNRTLQKVEKYCHCSRVEKGLKIARL
jgi:hypothetical protein